MVSDVDARLHEAWSQYGYLYCEACDTKVDLSNADSYTEARDIAVEHHQENHD